MREVILALMKGEVECVEDGGSKYESSIIMVWRYQLQMSTKEISYDL